MMKSCAKIQLLLPEYAADELTPAVRVTVAEHLAACPACGAELALEERLLDELGSVPLVSCPDHISEEILAVVEGQPAPRRGSHRQPWLWTAGSLVAAGLALLLLLPGTGPAPVPAPDTAFSDTEIQAASGQARLALARVVRVIDSNEKSTLKKVLSREIPTAVGATLLRHTRNLQGDT